MNREHSLKILIYILIFSIMLPTTIAFAANSKYNPSQKVYVHDNANILSPSDEVMLESLAIEYVRNYDLNVLFLTFDDADGKTTVRYGDDYVDAFFPYGVENNIAFIVDMDNREIYINTMGVAIEKLSDHEIDRALDLAYMRVSKGYYADALESMADYCLDVIVNDSSNSGRTFGSCLLIGAVVASIVTVIVVILLVGNHNAANKSLAATNYLGKGDYRVIDRNETLIRMYDTVQRNYYKPQTSSGGGRSGGSSHRSSSGRSHGGGGRRF